MNRRHTFTLSVIAVLGLTLLPGSAISQQTMQMAQSNTNRFQKGPPPIKPNALVDAKANHGPPPIKPNARVNTKAAVGPDVSVGRKAGRSQQEYFVAPRPRQQ